LVVHASAVDTASGKSKSFMTSIKRQGEPVFVWCAAVQIDVFFSASFFPTDKDVQAWSIYRLGGLHN